VLDVGVNAEIVSTSYVLTISIKALNIQLLSFLLGICEEFLLCTIL